MNDVVARKLRSLESLDDLYPEVSALCMTPGWNKPTPSLWPEPRKTFRPMHWQFEHAKPGLETAAKYISTDLAERRNFMLFNPEEGNTYAATRTMAAAYQMILPGEKARSHRHTPNALRLVLEGEEGVYTVVNGQALPMRPGDVLLTPGWHWHGHANDGTSNAYWIDVLDVPLVQILEPMFYEAHPNEFEEIDEWAETSPFIFPWSEFKPRLAAIEAAEDQLFSRIVSFDDATSHLKTLNLALVALDNGFRGKTFRSTANSLYAVIEGAGRSIIDGEVFEWNRGDVFVAPGWRSQVHEGQEDAALLRVTDRPVMDAIGGYRREIDAE